MEPRPTHAVSQSSSPLFRAVTSQHQSRLNCSELCPCANQLFWPISNPQLQFVLERFTLRTRRTEANSLLLFTKVTNAMISSRLPQWISQSNLQQVPAVVNLLCAVLVGLNTGWIQTQCFTTSTSFKAFQTTQLAHLEKQESPVPNWALRVSEVPKLAFCYFRTVPASFSGCDVYTVQIKSQWTNMPQLYVDPLHSGHNNSATRGEPWVRFNKLLPSTCNHTSPPHGFTSVQVRSQQVPLHQTSIKSYN